jgi:hypothetical protein
VPKDAIAGSNHSKVAPAILVVAVNVVVPPGQALMLLGETETTGNGLTFIVTSSVEVQLSAYTVVTVYVVVVNGVATGLAIFGLDKPVVGVQKYLTTFGAGEFEVKFTD